MHSRQYETGQRERFGALACAILGPSPMLHVFFGKDSFFLRERLDELRSSLDDDGMLASNTIVLDGRKTSLAEVTAACDTVPFLAAHRLVIVEGLLARLAAVVGAAEDRRRIPPPGSPWPTTRTGCRRPVTWSW
jgi:hypothetical protein